MAAPALKPCPVCRGAGGFLGRGFAVCDCGMLVERASRAKAAADWDRLSDLAQARTNAAVRAALEEVLSALYVRATMPLTTATERMAVSRCRRDVEEMLARLDAAPSAQPEGDADAD